MIKHGDTDRFAIALSGESCSRTRARMASLNQDKNSGGGRRLCRKRPSNTIAILLGLYREPPEAIAEEHVSHEGREAVDEIDHVNAVSLSATTSSVSSSIFLFSINQSL